MREPHHHPAAPPIAAWAEDLPMTYDTAVWKPDNDLPDPSAEFERRAERSDERYPQYRPPIPELLTLADLLEAEFTGPSPWEDLRGSLDGDFLYLTMSYDRGWDVEQSMARKAPALGLVVYSPLSGAFVSRPTG